MSRHALCALLLASLATALGEGQAGPPPAPPPLAEDADFCVAVMLLGSVAFVMMLFYWLHWHDDDIRTAAWSVVSTSICIFTGVLVGMSWNQSFVYFVIGPPAEAGPVKIVLCNVWAAVGWYALLQIVLMFVSGAVGPRPTHLVTTVLNLKCFAVLLGITNGASNLTLWGLVQTLAPHTAAGIMGVFVVCIVSMGTMFKIGDLFRYYVSISDADGAEDEYEKLWDKFAEETENGALSMTLAHLLVQATRFRITGVMPLPAGQVPPGAKPSTEDVYRLVLAGFGYAALIPITDLLLNVPRFPRFKAIVKTVEGNAFAFCLLYSMTWTVGEVINLAAPPAQMLLALGTTFLGMIIIFFLDYLKDMKCTGDDFDREIKALVGPISLLMGFGWKQAFVGSLTTITAKVRLLPTPFQTTGMAFVLVLVVVPAWRLYILPTVMKEMVDQAERSDRKQATSNEVKPVSSTVVTPLLQDQLKNGEDLPPNELMKQNLILQRRNQELESSIRDIRNELAELKQLAAILA